MKAVYYSVVLTSESAVYRNQWIRSIHSLRKFNRTIPVHLFLFNEPVPPPILAVARECDVTVHQLGDYRDRLAEIAGDEGAALSCIPTLNKLIPLKYFTSQTSQILFLDCDTFFFGDVDALFSKYRECDWYAREEAHSRRSPFFAYRSADTDEDKLYRIAAETGAAPIPPYNSGVMMLNRGLSEKLFALRKEFFRYAWRLALGARLSPGIAIPQELEGSLSMISEGGPGDYLEFPSRNFWILEQIALWLTLGRIPGLSHGRFLMGDVLQNGEFLIFRSYRTKSTVVHYLRGNEALFVEDSAG